MKTRYIIAGLLMSMVLGAHARNFVQNEEIYVNVQQNDEIGDWSKDGARIYLYLFTDESHYAWLETSREDGSIFKGKFASACTYNKAIVVRGTSASWDGKWNQTGDIDIPNDWNCIDDFANAEHRWKMYSPIPGKVASYANGTTKEQMSICANAAGGPLSLKAKLNSAKTEYVYSTIHGHAWYTSANGTTWTAMDPYAGEVRDAERNIDTLITLPATIPATGIYYYLHSCVPAGRRLIYLKPDADKCDLDCEITSFETAISAVNADNNTYTLDGMVAFGKANGQLVIECDGQTLTISDPKSPQSFSLHGVPAATENGKTTTATAYFQGDQTNCAKTITINVPNATEAVQTVKKDELIGNTIELTPKDTVAGYAFIWLRKNVQANQLDTLKQGTYGKKLTVSPYAKDSTDTFIFKEYYPASGSMEDMMTNGNYEEDNGYGSYGQVSEMSDYNFWGYLPQTENTQIHFYDNTTVNPNGLNSNGFAVVRNSNYFAPSYAKVQAREGSNFALFDAATGSEGGNKKAWYATTAKNPKLKLQKGTTYVLSFWAANINNYGEMDNAARFIFRIEYNGKKWESGVLDLSQPDFRNNIWHQHSETFYAEESSNNVTISVVNLNTNILNIGNDFALDDIQFHPISSVSKVVKSQQQFIVTAHEPKVDAFTATTQNMLCSADQFTVNMSVQYRNAHGSLCIRDVDRDAVYQYTVPEKAIEEQGTFDCAIELSDALAAVHNWEAYFQLKPANNKTAQSAAPVRYSCEKVDTTLCEGETVEWKGTTYPKTPFIGTDTFISGYDSLILTIHAIPRILTDSIALTCDKVGEIRIPFTVTNGNPDMFDIEVKENHYTGTVDGADIVFSLTPMTAGEYAAVVTIGETGSICESTADIHFSIAISDQVFSKWTDVLFVSNKDGRYTNYQWIADGVELPGETQQRLYDPNGLNGTTILYQCRLTTVDGQTLYTCPQTFDEVTPSRTITENQQQVIGIYDTMGRPVVGTPKRGIYIVVSEINGQRVTNKTIIYE